MDDDASNQLALVAHAYQGAVIHHRASDGYINATAMCQAAGKEWAGYRRNDTTEDFLEALEGSLQIRRDLLIQSIINGPHERRGTWVHPQIAIHLAQWLSAAFAVKVSQWVFEWISGKDPTAKVWQQFEDRISLVNDNVPDGYFCVFRELADVFAALITHGCDPGTQMILDISVGQHWSNHWNEQELYRKFGQRRYFPHFYPKYFSQSLSNPQSAACYPEDALPTFRRWLREAYVPHKMPEYLKKQVAMKKLPAQIANDAIVALSERERKRAIPVVR